MTENKSSKQKVAKVAQVKNDGKVAKVANNKAAAENTVNVAKDRFIWILAILIICCAIGGNYYAQQKIIDESSLMRLGRVALVIVTIALGLGVTLLTQKGKKFISFLRESYVELRKVVWPTKQESVQTTIIVFVAVCLVSLFLYLCDVVFLQLVRAITL